METSKNFAQNITRETILKMNEADLRKYLKHIIGETISELQTEDRYINEEKTLKKFSVGKSTLAKWRKEGKISYYPLTSKNFLYDSEEIEEIIKETEVSKF